MGPRRVVAPDGVEWCIARKWMMHRARVLRRRPNATDSLQSLGSGMSDRGRRPRSGAVGHRGGRGCDRRGHAPCLRTGVDHPWRAARGRGGGTHAPRSALGGRGDLDDPLRSGRRLEWRVTINGDSHRMRADRDAIRALRRRSQVRKTRDRMWGIRVSLDISDSGERVHPHRQPMAQSTPASLAAAGSSPATLSPTLPLSSASGSLATTIGRFTASASGTTSATELSRDVMTPFVDEGSRGAGRPRHRDVAIAIVAVETLEK